MEALNALVIGPVLPATLALGFLLLWCSFGLLGAIDLDLPGNDLDLDIDIDVSAPSGPETVTGFSIVLMRWLNIHAVPLIIWMGVFIVVWWLLSATSWTLLDSHLFSANWIWSTLLVIRNLFIAGLITKFATAPMRPWFLIEKHTSLDLIGKECQISSSTASPDFGQVKFPTDGAPLLLNVRTDGVHLARGARVWITHYDPKRRVYIVSPTQQMPAHVDISETKKAN